MIVFGLIELPNIIHNQNMDLCDRKIPSLFKDEFLLRLSGSASDSYSVPTRLFSLKTRIFNLKLALRSNPST